jgi:hypothetical protein
MKLVLQVAAGVFIAILAVLGVYTLVQTWEAHVYERRQVEQQRMQAEARQAAMAHAAKRLDDLTPETLASLCGSPIGNRVDEGAAKGFYWLAMYYMGSDGRKIEMRFQCIQGYKCGGAYMNRTEHYVYDSPANAPYEPHTKDDGTFYSPPATKLIEELPCLARQQ